MRLAGLVPAEGPGAMVSLREPSYEWLLRRHGILRRQLDTYHDLIRTYCGGNDGGAVQAFEDEASTQLHRDLHDHAPRRAGLFDSRLVVPPRGWSVEALYWTTVELRRRKVSAQDGLTCGCQ
jgi:hypothetical protein